ncbi:Macrolide-specific efflux protein MacA precursor [Thiorhodovibrio winogradskyi]|uniref:Macrolide-specific efflux protein MacA n=1 Tax=Thiorhodovibrio winogradskyi TaxID=77007 RepID=A0ABZ0SFX2_9GAMM|nr:efflux RND transporter periplasmic adaptor subunit [Thiorhodovibrio winogradskyi]
MTTAQPIPSLLALSRGELGTKEFWARYVRQLAELCAARRALLVVRAQDQWKTLFGWNPQGANWPLTDQLRALAAAALEQGLARQEPGPGPGPDAPPDAPPDAAPDAAQNQPSLMAVRLDVGPQDTPPVVLLELAWDRPLQQAEAILAFAAAIPASFQLSRQYRQARLDLVFFAELMRLVGAIAADERFRLAAMRLCNVTASLFQCAQVSLGWCGTDGARAVAISHLDQFDRDLGSVRDLESAMEEAVDQDAELLWPGELPGQIQRAHQTYAASRAMAAVLSLPLRDQDRVVAVLTLERKQGRFSDQDVWRARLLLEQITRWLLVLEHKSHWFGRRWWRDLRAWTRTQARLEHSGRKLAVLLGLLVLGLGFLDLLPHRIEAPFLLKATDAVQVSAPVDSQLQRVLVEPGDLFDQDELLVELDTRALLTDQAAALARLARHSREVEKAKATNALADMRVALLMVKETEAELQRIDFLLEQSRVTAPFAGVVVEGDLRTRIGAPVRQGEELMTLASMEQLFVRISLDEKEVVEVAPGDQAEARFVGRPEQRYRIRLTRLWPGAQVENNQSVFNLDAEFISAREPWWRPGMSGVVRIEAGRISLWKLLSKDILDHLRLKFWL